MSASARPGLPRLNREALAAQFRGLDPRDPGVWPLLPRLAAWAAALLLVLVAGALAVLSDEYARLERERAREAAARGARALAQSIVEVVPTPLMVLDARMNLVTANQACFATFGSSLAEAAGRSLFELGGGAWDTPAVREALQAAAAAHTPLTAWPATLPGTASQGLRKVWLSVRRMRASEVGADLVLLVADPVEPAQPASPA